MKQIALIGGTIALAVVIVLAVLASCGGGGKTMTLTPKAVVTTAPMASASPSAPGRHTVTYIVTGTPATAVYGPAGSTFTNTSPMRVTRPLRHPKYYAITARMQGVGHVTCQILIGGKTVATASASGPLGIALCKIIPDPFTGVWTDARDEPTAAG